MSDSNVVLVVDDEALLRWHATDLLAANGYQILEAEDSSTALRILKERPDVRVLFTDVQMPGADDGLALAEQVHERWPHILLLVTSGDVSVSDKDLPDSGRFMAKPYDPVQMVGLVDDLVARGKERNK